MTDDKNAPVEFGELPPKDGRPRAIFTEATAALKERPGAWAKIATRRNREAARQFVYNARYGAPAAFRPVGAFELEYRGCDVWARYIGDAA